MDSIVGWLDSHRDNILSNANSTPGRIEMVLEHDRYQKAKSLHAQHRHLKRARSLAESECDEEFLLWCDCFLSSVLGEMQDFQGALDVLAEAAVKARDKRFIGLPQQIMVNVLLVSQMSDIDPLGYLTEINQASEYLAPACRQDMQHGCVLYGSLLQTYIEVADLEKAEHYNRLRVQAAEATNKDFYRHKAYLESAVLAHRMQRWGELLIMADLSFKGHGRHLDGKHNSCLARALALIHQGDAKEAKLEYRRGMRSFNEVRPEISYYLATHFWLAQDRVDRAIEQRLDQLTTSKGLAKYWEQATVALHLVEMYLSLGDHEQASAWANQTREFCTSLRNAQPLLDRLTMLRSPISLPESGQPTDSAQFQSDRCAAFQD